jgi:hypothetical protein
MLQSQLGEHRHGWLPAYAPQAKQWRKRPTISRVFGAAEQRRAEATGRITAEGTPKRSERSERPESLLHGEKERGSDSTSHNRGNLGNRPVPTDSANYNC